MLHLESEFPELKKLWRYFERPHNFDQARGKELYEWLLAAELPEELLRANAALRPALHPALPAREDIGHIVAYHKKSKMKTPLLYLAATFGYLPLLFDPSVIVHRRKVSGPRVPLFGHPWLLHDNARLALDVADRQHLASFTCWRISVLSDTTEDRKTRIVH